MKRGEKNESEIFISENREKNHIEEYPNFHKSGSIRGMKDKYYGKNAMLVKCGSYIYNVPEKIYNLAH